MTEPAAAARSAGNALWAAALIAPDRHADVPRGPRQERMSDLPSTLRGMSVAWGLTVDCARPRELAAFWAVALGYVEPPPPEGSVSWEAWLVAQGVPRQEWDDAAYLIDPDRRAPSLSFLRVPEPKTSKNRLHVDVKASGGRDKPAELRRRRIQDVVDRLVAAGAAVELLDQPDGVLDHVVMTDPEGNEFCVV